MPQNKYKYDYIRLSAEKVLHCQIFDCKHGVYPKTICCRHCPVYAECDDHCLNHPDRCKVWESPAKRKEREMLIRDIVQKTD